MRRFFIGGGLAALLGLGAFFAFSSGSSPAVESTGRVSRMPRYGGRSWPAAGSSAPASTNLCDYLAAGDKAGSWWCVNGDGSTPSGSVALTANNAPPVVTLGGAKQARLNAAGTSDNQYFKTATVTPPTGTFTACAIYTKIDQANADYVNLSDHVGDYDYILQDNGTLSHSYDFSAASSNSSAPTGIEAMQCTVFISGVSTSICIFAASEFAGCSSPLAVSNTALASTHYAWYVGGGAIAGYNLRGFFRGAFMTEKALTSADLARISAFEIPNPPSLWTAYLDGADIDKQANSTFTNLDPLATWSSLSAVTDFTNGTVAGNARINTTEGSASFSGINDFVTSVGGAASFTFMHNTGIFDALVTVRRRGTSLAGAPRRIFGNAASNKGITVSNDEAGHFVVNLYNGSSDIAAFTTTTAVAPIGVPTSVLIRGDGTNIKVSTDFVTFADTKAFTGAGPAGGSATDMAVGASGTGETAGVHRYDGDIGQLVVWPAILNASQMLQAKAYADARRAAMPTQHVCFALGDSLTEGLNTVYPWPARVTGALRSLNISVANHGKSGDDTGGASTRWTNYIKSRGYSCVVLTIGVNNILNGDSAATTEGLYASLIADIQSTGLKVVVNTITPFGNYGGSSAPKEAQRILFNTWIRGLAVDAVIDQAANMADTDVTKLKASYDIGDGLHFNDLGNAAYATPVVTALTSVRPRRFAAPHRHLRHELYARRHAGL